jgi:hypothetical protein
MKKYFICFIVVLFFYGCEKDYNSVIEPVNYNYQVIAVVPVQPFIYYPNNSTFLKIQFNSIANIRSVSLDIYSPAGEKLNASALPMTGIDNNTFSYTLRMQDTDLSGVYTVKYYVTDLSGSIKEAAVQKFEYNNGTANTAPEIISVLIDPDTLVVTDSTDLLVTAQVTDAQGLNDIELVYFIVYRPDGSTSGFQNVLNDLGITGDETAGDGIFSLGIYVDENNVKGTYVFEFRSRDRGKLLSNIISYNVLIQ